MSSDAWPSPEAAPAPLPRLEDLPIAERGYDQEAVRLAFDSFYRHAAQLDASLRALEAVEIFRRDADALRNDLRALRSLGLGGSSPDPSWAVRSYERERREVSGAVLRLAFEAALLVAVAVVAGVGHFRTPVIVALMAGAFAIVALSEWLASRSRFIPPSVGFLAQGEPAPYVEAPAPPWAGPQALEPGEDTEPDALTMIAAPAADDDVGGWEPGDDDGDDEPEPELAERSGFFRRRRR
ncbi:MAG TPA: hypothetical protein VHQ89_12635 [Gaiellaceae bacterium]|jgi:hypothetical protein|nr:hypothetical protein [Gaiellaceae bacterium]